MRNLLKLFSATLLLFVAGYAQAQSSKDMIAKKWKINETEFIEKMKGLYPEQAKEIEDSKEQILTKFGKPEVHYKTDGTYESINSGKVSTGTWSLSSDNKKLITVRDGQEREFQIVELSAKRLVIDMGSPQLPPIPLMPAE